MTITSLFIEIFLKVLQVCNQGKISNKMMYCIYMNSKTKLAKKSPSHLTGTSVPWLRTVLNHGTNQAFSIFRYILDNYYSNCMKFGQDILYGLGFTDMLRKRGLISVILYNWGLKKVVPCLVPLP